MWCQSSPDNNNNTIKYTATNRRQKYRSESKVTLNWQQYLSIAVAAIDIRTYRFYPHYTKRLEQYNIILVYTECFFFLLFVCLLLSHARCPNGKIVVRSNWETASNGTRLINGCGCCCCCYAVLTTQIKEREENYRMTE